MGLNLGGGGVGRVRGRPGGGHGPRGRRGGRRPGPAGSGQGPRATGGAPRSAWAAARRGRPRRPASRIMGTRSRRFAPPAWSQSRRGGSGGSGGRAPFRGREWRPRGWLRPPRGPRHGGPEGGPGGSGGVRGFGGPPPGRPAVSGVREITVASVAGRAFVFGVSTAQSQTTSTPWSETPRRSSTATPGHPRCRDDHAVHRVAGSSAARRTRPPARRRGAARRNRVAGDCLEDLRRPDA